ncbi:hypothetical protein NQ318_020924 [Aromia moschata]|uniref:Uncharacterized protein n=1 Tax=Aromia moschata TaxID=1265417 RepID=A0AAV8XBH2_9CUCU|nr:hypothetical protein NQ318_020924 [Aromia moschata]
MEANTQYPEKRTRVKQIKRSLYAAVFIKQARNNSLSIPEGIDKLCEINRWAFAIAEHVAEISDNYLILDNIGLESPRFQSRALKDRKE